MVKTIVQGAMRRYGVAAAEVAHQDKWQRADLGFAVVSPSQSHAQEVIDTVERFVWSFPEVEVIDTTVRWVEE